MKYVEKEIDPKINVNVSGANPLKDFLVLLAGIVGIILVVYLALGLIVDFLARKKNPELEKQLGRIFVFGKNENRSEKIESIFKHLLEKVEKDGLDYSVLVVNDDSVENALIMPGRKILLFSGLLKKIKSENELAFILAHEIGHAENNDHIRSIGRGLVLVMISTVIMGENNFINSIVAESTQKAGRIYSQSQETKADLFAINLVNKVYGHVSGSLDFFNRQKEKEKGGLFIFSTHPSSKKRIEKLNEYISKNKFEQGKIRDFKY